MKKKYEKQNLGITEGATREYKVRNTDFRNSPAMYLFHRWFIICVVYSETFEINT